MPQQKQNPIEGKHPIKCSKCNKDFAEVQHYGGENILKSCAFCEGMEQECPDCFLKDK